MQIYFTDKRVLVTGQKEMLSELASDVRFGAASRRGTQQFRNSGRLRLLPSRQRTSRRDWLDVW